MIEEGAEEVNRGDWGCILLYPFGLFRFVCIGYLLY